MSLLWGEDDWLIAPVGTSKKLEDQEDSIFERLKKKLLEPIEAATEALAPAVEEPWQDPMPEGPLETYYPEPAPEAPMTTGFEDAYTIGAPYAEDAAPPELFSGSDVAAWGIQQEPTSVIEDLLNSIVPFRDRLATALGSDADPWANVEDLRPPVDEPLYTPAFNLPPAPDVTINDDPWLIPGAGGEDDDAGPNQPSFMDMLSEVISGQGKRVANQFDDIPGSVLAKAREPEIITDFFGNPKYTLNRDTGQYDEMVNPVVGENGDVGSFLEKMLLEAAGGVGTALSAGQEYVWGPLGAASRDLAQGAVENPLAIPNAVLQAVPGPAGETVDAPDITDQYQKYREENRALTSGEAFDFLPDILQPIAGAGYYSLNDPGTLIGPAAAAKLVPESIPAAPVIRGLLDQGGATAAIGGNVGAAAAGEAAQRAGVDSPMVNLLIQLMGGVAGAGAGAIAPAALADAASVVPTRLPEMPPPDGGLAFATAGGDAMPVMRAMDNGPILPDTLFATRDTDGRVVRGDAPAETNRLADLAMEQVAQRPDTEARLGDFRTEQATAYRQRYDEVYAQTGDAGLADLAGKGAAKIVMDKAVEATITPEQAVAAREFVRQQWMAQPAGTWDFRAMEANRIIDKLQAGERLQPAEQDLAVNLFRVPESPIAAAFEPAPPMRTELYDGPNTVRDPLWKPFEGLEDVPTPRVQDQPPAPTALPEAGLRQVAPDNPLFKTREEYNPAAGTPYMNDPRSPFTAGQQVSDIPEDLKGVIGVPQQAAMFNYESLLGKPGAAMDMWLSDTRAKLSGIDPNADSKVKAKVTGKVTNDWASTFIDQRRRLETMLQHEGIGVISKEQQAAMAKQYGRWTKGYAEALHNIEAQSKAQMDDLVDEASKRIINEAFPAGTPENVRLSLEAGSLPRELTEKAISKMSAEERAKELAKRDKKSMTAPFIKGGRLIRNTMFGVSDMGAILQQGLAAGTTAGPQVVVGAINRMLEAVGAPHVNVYQNADEALERIRVGAHPGQLTGIVQSPLSQDGTLLSPILRRAGDTAFGVDSRINALADKLNDVQFGKVMGGMNTTIYEGNMILAKLAQKLGVPVDANSMAVKESAMRLANAATLRGNLAQTQGRRTAEELAMLSPSMRRAQVEWLKIATDAINPRASMEDRLLGSMAVASTVTAIVGALAVNEATGLVDIDVNPFDGKFGHATFSLPGNDRRVVVDLFPQRQVQELIAQSFTNIANADPKQLISDLGEFELKQMSPAGRMLASLGNIGYDPATGARYFDYTSGNSAKDLLLSVVPPGVGALLNGQNEDVAGQVPYQALLNFFGGNTYYESKFDAAAMEMSKAGQLLDADGNPISVERYRDLAQFPLARKTLLEANPQIVDMEPTEENRALASLIDAEKAFKANVDAKYVAGEIKNGEFRAGIAEHNQNIGMLAKSLVTEAKKHEGEEWRWIEGYYQTFVNDPVAGQLDDEATEAAQQAFWASLGDREATARKYIYAYSDIGDSEAEQAYHDDLRRLNGYDPETGERLLDAKGQPLPNYFALRDRRYLSQVLTNEESQKIEDEARAWYESMILKNPPPAGAKVKEPASDEIHKAYMQSQLGWQADDPRIFDVIAYGKDKYENPEFTAYSKQHPEWLAWFDDGYSWDMMQLIRKN